METKGNGVRVDAIKKTGVMAGAVVGGIIGGGVSLVGKLSGVKFLDEVGESIVDSAICTGGIAGDLVGGTADVLVGKITSDDERVRAGAGDLTSGGRKIAGNIVDNVKTLADCGGEIARGIGKRDGKRVLRGAKTLAKVIVVGAVTVGAIRVKKSEEETSDDASR
ncbi:MAG: hypothetical protein LBP30_06490 [Clostridiales Family XIII bacterium]|jgi:hypothetical protein|nr:hypothetical protein [Clostridiales Family XIII bacterium]